MNKTITFIVIALALTLLGAQFVSAQTPAEVELQILKEENARLKQEVQRLKEENAKWKDANARLVQENVKCVQSKSRIEEVATKRRADVVKHSKMTEEMESKYSLLVDMNEKLVRTSARMFEVYQPLVEENVKLVKENQELKAKLGIK